jgi:hypothetical protein
VTAKPGDSLNAAQWHRELTMPGDATQTLADVLAALRSSNLQRQAAFVEWLAESWYDARQALAEREAELMDGNGTKPGDSLFAGQNEGGKMEAVITPIEVMVGGTEKIKIEAGLESRIALRRDALRSLHDALGAIKTAEEIMPAMDDATVRAPLEDMATGLAQATRACDALWYLAPEYDDGEPVEDE